MKGTVKTQLIIIIIKQLFGWDEHNLASPSSPSSPSSSGEKDWIGPCPMTGENVAQEEILTSDFWAQGP